MAKAIKAATVVTTSASDSKAAKARVIFGEAYADMTKVPARKDILARLQTEVGLTPAGAATYLQNYKRDNGLSKGSVAKA